MQRCANNIIIEDNQKLILNNLSVSALKDIIHSKELVNALQHSRITAVQCINSGLNRLDTETLALFSSAFENSAVELLDLSDNNLGLCTSEQLRALITGLKKTVIDELYLENNHLAKLGSDQFRQLLQYISAALADNLILLDLDDNNLWWLGKHGLETLIQFISASKVSVLSVDCNRLHLFQPETYRDTKFSGISVQLAHYMEMQYFQEKGAHLGSIFQKIPSLANNHPRERFNYANKLLLSEEEFRAIMNNQLPNNYINYFSEHGILTQDQYVLMANSLIHTIEKLLADNELKEECILANRAKA